MCVCVCVCAYVRACVSVYVYMCVYLYTCVLLFKCCVTLCVGAVLRTHAGGTLSGSAETVCEPRCWEDGTECQQCGHE